LTDATNPDPEARDRAERPKCPKKGLITRPAARVDAGAPSRIIAGLSIGAGADGR
jgi:hypothetical protein